MRCLFPDLTYNARVPDVATKSVAQLMSDVGGNTGNLLFRYAVANQIDDELTPCTFKEAVGLSVSKHYDAVVVAAANWLHSTSPNHNRHRAKALREINLPTLVIGLGCQHHEPTIDKLSFHEDTLGLLDVLRELDAHILVRDETTLAQCRHHGLKRVAVIGCPSNFINHAASFGEDLIHRCSRSNPERITLNAGWFDSLTQEFDAKILPHVIRTGGNYVLQSDHHNIIAMAMARSREFSRADVACFDRMFRFKRFSWRSAWKFDNFLQSLRVFYDVDEWLAAARQWDLVLGCRIHGAMVAIQAGVPAILTTIDSRTKGLAKTMAIPHVDLAAVAKWPADVPVTRIFDEVSPDFPGYIEKRRVLAEVYAQWLRAFGLRLTVSFEDLLAARRDQP